VCGSVDAGVVAAIDVVGDAGIGRNANLPRRRPSKDGQHQLAGVVLQRIASVPHHD
jgi:hypothetical protein